MTSWLTRDVRAGVTVPGEGVRTAASWWLQRLTIAQQHVTARLIVAALGRGNIVPQTDCSV